MARNNSSSDDSVFLSGCSPRNEPASNARSVEVRSLTDLDRSLPVHASTPNSKKPAILGPSEPVGHVSLQLPPPLTVSSGSNPAAGATGGSSQKRPALAKDGRNARVSFFSVGSAAVCRICHSGEQSLPFLGGKGGEPLVSLCACRGTMGLLHRSCLEHWLAQSQTTQCEICTFQYHTVRRPKPLTQFWHAADYRCERRQMVADCICLCILTPLAWASACLCIHGAIYYSHLQMGAVEVPGLVILAVFLLITYCTWLAITVRYHWTVIHEWRNKHQDVKLVLHQPRRTRRSRTAVGNVLAGGDTDAHNTHALLLVGAV